MAGLEPVGELGDLSLGAVVTGRLPAEEACQGGGGVDVEAAIPHPGDLQGTEEAGTRLALFDEALNPLVQLPLQLCRQRWGRGASQ